MRRRVRGGEAFERLVEEHYDDVLAYCRRHAPSWAEAPDLAQESFLRFVRSGRVSREGKSAAYLFAIARNLCIDAARKRQVLADPLDADVPDCSSGADPAEALVGSEVGALVEALDPVLREVVELRFDQGLKVGEIAEVLGVSRFAVSRRLNRALAELRRGLEGKDDV